MATAAKRPKVPGGSELTRLQDFLRWCDSVGLVLSSKVSVSNEGTVADYGMLATADIEEGEVLFTVPRSALLHQGTVEVSALLEKQKSSLQSSSGWVPLLLALLHEYTSSRSRWTPYLSLWTDFRTLDHPMFWSKEERERLLRGTGVPEAVDKDLTNIRREYEDVALPFMLRHADLWSPRTHTLDLYTRLVAFVMAYSFQEPQEEEDNDDEEDEEEEERAPNPPMMVPMADMLNHVSNHNANLEFTPSEDGLRASRSSRRRGVQHLRPDGQLAAASHVRLHRAVSKQRQRDGRRPRLQPLRGRRARCPVGCGPAADGGAAGGAGRDDAGERSLRLRDTRLPDGLGAPHGAEGAVHVQGRALGVQGQRRVGGGRGGRGGEGVPDVLQRRSPRVEGFVEAAASRDGSSDAEVLRRRRRGGGGGGGAGPGADGAHGSAELQAAEGAAGTLRTEEHPAQTDGALTELRREHGGRFFIMSQ
ncbi:N-lysine methyltransferase setd6 isoform X1 [Embiotoca jacksoni]|uniref:N-lysine methyltransferase setd6 isoform X1 n=1 Tax=Embiotoca jacksoni TaxID=100190 RepID=UPI003704A8C6